MSLRDFAPIIDDRTYDDIVEEALTRIPRYTDEWTDYNASDPGRTLIELFAWMSELLIFRLGQTPALNYVKFLELIGMELAPAQPARAEVSFAARPGFPDPTIFIPERTQVSADGPDGPIIFETEKSLVLFTAALEAVQVFDGYAFRNITAANLDVGAAYRPLGPRPASDAALLVGFEAAAPFPTDILSLTVWAAQSERHGGAATACGEGVSQAEASLVWEYNTGGDWREMTLLSDDTLAFARSGEIRLKTPPPGEMAPALVGRAADAPRYWIRARVERANYTQAPEILAIRHNTVPVLNAESAADEVLGGSDGTMGQILTLVNRPVIDGTELIEVDEGGEGGAEAWTRVDDFFASGPGDRHYTLNRTTGEVTFGNGDQGRIPVANLRNPAGSIIARRYRFGGGVPGNVPAGAINALLGAVEGLDSNRIENPFAAYGGKDEETLAEAEQRVPHVLRGRDRAVTADDFERLATQVGPVRRAKALPLHVPGCPGVAVPGAITVIIVPESDGSVPVPSDQLIRAVCAYLDERRLMTTELYVRPPTYVDIRVTASLVASTGIDAAQTQTEAEAALRRFLDPFDGGDDGTGWPIGGPIYYSAIFRQLLIAGVLRIAELSIEMNGEILPDCADARLPTDALIRQLDHRIRVVSETDAAALGA